jgi:hypothetical protein
MKDTPVSVRFSDHISSRLEEISGQTGIGKAEIIRRATEEYLTRVQAAGQITIPLISAEANGHGGTVIINNHGGKAHYTKRPPKKSKP